jgi:hypothetical protein
MHIVHIVKTVAKYALILGLINYVGGDYVVGMLKELGYHIGGMVGHG